MPNPAMMRSGLYQPSIQAKNRQFGVVPASQAVPLNQLGL
jgi:hypothetical protein